MSRKPAGEVPFTMKDFAKISRKLMEYGKKRKKIRTWTGAPSDEEVVAYLDEKFSKPGSDEQ